ncbi:MAG: protein kinase, partial [Thermoanaerobaculia bacterium]|nr:protein kinase [Thermoanaerobaculia bacterium]
MDPIELQRAETLRRAVPEDVLVSGAVIGRRYRLQARIGMGGMGEVWGAYDLKLRMDVAIKVMRRDRFESEKATELLRREVRNARDVASPNVCRLFELIESGERELLVMELVDGSTLKEVIAERGPLDLKEAQQIASQFLSGLEEIHRAGLVHRDVKPENVMVTRTGRVVVMDLGLARGVAEGSGSISGTPPYMPIEQVQGRRVDRRVDVFAAGVLLAEMIDPAGGTVEARYRLWEGIREDPPRLPETPWSGVLRKAVGKAPEKRFGSAGELLRALEEATLRVEGAEHLHPYPGASAFTESDAEYFFGREAEVEQMWKRITVESHLLGLIGPSGVGKSSFLRAGLLPAKPEGWRVVIATPGERPFIALARALADELSGEAVKDLLAIEDLETALSAIDRWRRAHEGTIVILDQFEELFTLNPPDVQERFAELLGRIPLQADTHVLLSMRDDFLFHCHRHEPLHPLLSDLTMIGAPEGTALRRAVVQPAMRCGYRLEDEALVDEIVGEVEGERGALPLMAFALARLWEKRDRENGLLTREAYEEIGGVSGALAQHAETTLDRIGPERIGIVRELFRNLVTAQQTRASRERGELLSVFPPEDRERVGEVLDVLIDARLLTSYESREEQGDAPGLQRIEVVHESLLTKWPRLVRWQAQDVEGAQLRDELRQAARVWNQHGRDDDYLWTGAAFREFQVWRERYPGGLTELEEDFSRRMTAHARWRQRRQWTAVAALFLLMTAALAVIGFYWRESEASTERAETHARTAELQTLRAEASKLLALGQLELETYPTAALAYAIRSLEIADTSEGRVFALRALAEGPPATFTPYPEEEGLESFNVAMSPGGEWLATGGMYRARVFRREGGEPVVVAQYEGGSSGMLVSFPSDRTLVTNSAGRLRAISVPSGEELWRAEIDEGPSSIFPGKDGFVTVTNVGDREVVRSWSLAIGEDRLIGHMGPASGEDRVIGQKNASSIAVLGGDWLAYSEDETSISVRSIEEWQRPARIVGRAESEVRQLTWHPSGDRIATLHQDGDVRVWPISNSDVSRVYPRLGEGLDRLRFDPGGQWLAAAGHPHAVPTVRLLDTERPSARPVSMRGRHWGVLHSLTFSEDGQWLLTGHPGTVALWPMQERLPIVFDDHRDIVFGVDFSPDSRTVISSSFDGTVRVWPVTRSSTSASRILYRGTLAQPKASFDPGGRYFAVAGSDSVNVVSLADGTIDTLHGPPSAWLQAVAISRDGRYVASGPLTSSRSDKEIRIWSLGSDDVHSVPTGGETGDGFAGGVIDL